MGGSLSEGETTPEGGLRVRVHEREWSDDPEWLGGGYLESVNDWWEDIPDVHGDIRIYTRDADEFVEFRIRFTDGSARSIAPPVDRQSSRKISERGNPRLENLSPELCSCICMSHSLTISGEDLASLLQFLLYLEMGDERDGLIHMTAKVPANVATPYIRAVMKREARLLTEDADAMGVGDREPRTPEQRRADAFADVMLSVANVLRYSPELAVRGGGQQAQQPQARTEQDR